MALGEFVGKIGPEVSLPVIAAIIAIAVVASLVRERRQPADLEAARSCWRPRRYRTRLCQRFTSKTISSSPSTSEPRFPTVESGWKRFRLLLQRRDAPDTTASATASDM